jgi:hypothetical protein
MKYTWQYKIILQFFNNTISRLIKLFKILLHVNELPHNFAVCGCKTPSRWFGKISLLWLWSHHDWDCGCPLSNTFVWLDQVYHAPWIGTIVVYIFLITSHNNVIGHMHIVHFGCVFHLWLLVFRIHRWNTNDIYTHFNYGCSRSVSPPPMKN